MTLCQLAARADLPRERAAGGAFDRRRDLPSSTSRSRSEAERSLQREIRATGALVDQLRKTRIDTFTVMARLIADLPKLKAAVLTNDPPTVQDHLRRLPEQLKSANLLLVTNADGPRARDLGRLGAGRPHRAWRRGPPSARRCSGTRPSACCREPDGILQVVTVPIAIGLTQPQILGSVSVGFLLNDALASQLKAMTGSDIAFGDGRRLLDRHPAARVRTHALADDCDTSGISIARLGGSTSTCALAAGARGRAATRDGAAHGGAHPAIAHRAAPLARRRFTRASASTAVVAVLLATLLSFAVARTITRPLAAITDVMREVAATGDLTRKIAVGEGRRWHDEDAQPAWRRRSTR